MDAEEAWSSQVVTGGHFGPVQDCSWDPSSSYLVSVSSDQTSRLVGPWKRGGVTTWHELARPQIHGHDLECIAFLRDFQFASGAEEKVIRAFDAPQAFLQSLENISQIEISSKLKERRAMTAATPALGLSNKAVFEGQAAPETEGPVFDDLPDEDEGMEGESSQTNLEIKPLILSQPPFEEQLFQNTLWVEIEKMYGHPYELFCLTTDHSASYLASTSKANQAEHAVIRLWDTKAWKQLNTLSGHSLTVTQVCFEQFLFSPSFLRPLSLLLPFLIPLFLSFFR